MHLNVYITNLNKFWSHKPHHKCEHEGVWHHDTVLKWTQNKHPQWMGNVAGFWVHYVLEKQSDPWCDDW